MNYQTLREIYFYYTHQQFADIFADFIIYFVNIFNFPWELAPLLNADYAKWANDTHLQSSGDF